MRRIVNVYEVTHNGDSVRILVEKYNSSNQYPTESLQFDLNSNIILPTSKSKSLGQVYINQFIYGILGRQGQLAGDYLSQVFNSDIPEYDLSIYPLGEDLELEFSGFILIQDTSLVDTKSKVLNIVNSSESVDEIVEGVKDLFDLVDKDESQESDLTQSGRTPSLIRPSNLSEITEVFSQFLSNQTYVKGNYVEFDVQNPYSDFISGSKDTELMTEIRKFYSAWERIEVEDIKSDVPEVTELYPVSDPSIYLKVGEEYVNVLPNDIQIKVGDSFIKLLQSGPTLPRVVVTDGVNQIDLVEDNLKLLSEDGLSTLTGVQYKSEASGVIGSDIYFRDSNGEFHSIPGMSKSLAMFKRKMSKTSCTRFRFYFK